MTLETIPTLDGFLTFIRNIMGVTVGQLADGNAAIEFSFGVASEIVNETLNLASPILYTQAVYNLAADTLVNFAIDVPPSTYWADLRKKWGIYNFFPGFVQSASDQGTSASMSIIADWAKSLTIANLMQMKTPYGRMYLSITQDLGPSVWGLT